MIISASCTDTHKDLRICIFIFTEGCLVIFIPIWIPGSDRLGFFVSFFWGGGDFEQLQMWVTETGHERVEGPAVSVWQIKAAVKVVVLWLHVCVCDGAQIEQHRLWLQGGGGNMCRRFDLWGSEHDNYYLPSKKLTTALKTSKPLCPFYYIIRRNNIGWLHQMSTHAPQSIPNPEHFCDAQNLKVAGV